MEFWIRFWTVFFFGSLVLFGGLAVVTVIGGFFNIRSLFKSLRQSGSADQPLPSAKAASPAVPTTKVPE